MEEGKQMSMSKEAVSMATEESNVRNSINGKTSKFLGVNKSRGKGDAYFASVYDSDKGWRVHLGTFHDEEEAARARDVASLKCSGQRAKFNFPVSDYEEILKLMENLTKDQVVTTIKRCSSRFVRAIDSNYRGVGRKAPEAEWKALKRVKDEILYLGSFETPEEAAMAYDVEAIKIKGWNAVTNFPIRLYNVDAIVAEPAIPTSEQDRAKFITKELLDMPQKYTKGKGKPILEQLVHQFRAQTTGPGETSNLTSSQTLNLADQNQLCDTANVETGRTQIGMSIEHKHKELEFEELTLEEPSPYHFRPGAINKFRHSSSSAFKPYKKT